MEMKRKTVLIVSYASAAFLALGGLAYSLHLKAEGYRLQLENAYQEAFTELVSTVGEMDTALQRSLYSSTPAMMGATCAEVYGKALLASDALSELPYPSFEMQKMSSFITQVGDYAYMLAKKAAAGAAITEEEKKNLVSLSQASAVLSNNLSQLMADLGSSGAGKGGAQAASGRASKLVDEAVSGFVKSSLSSMEGEFPETPQLIYDGPFSSHILGLKPKLLEGKKEISREEALKKAADFMGLKPEQLKADGERGGNMPVYIFYANSDGGTISVEVTKAGGYVSDAFNSRPVKSRAISPKDAAAIAARFLEKHGYRNMKKSYELIEDNAMTVNFAYAQGSVICYPDLVKVTVALDNGAVVGFESQGYIMNHVERNLPNAQVTEQAARSKVSPELKVLSHEMAVIPTSGKNEVFCHEFKCENSGGDHYIVYVNALTGAEEKILILIESDNGTLAI